MSLLQLREPNAQEEMMSMRPQMLRVQRLAPPLQQRWAHGKASEEACRLLRERKSAHSFATDPVPDAILADILRITQRAPSSFNMQPYACVLVREQADRDRLAEGMLATNGDKVKQAPVVAVFAADLEPSRRVPRIQQLMYENGASPASVSQLPLYMRMFSGQGHLAVGVQSLISTMMSPLRPIPTAAPALAWSFKQTGFAASAFLQAAEAHGLVARAMEGFDQERIKVALDIPDRYAIPVVICCGYPSAQDADDVVPRASSARLEPTEVFFDGKFGQSSGSIFESK